MTNQVTEFSSKAFLSAQVRNRCDVREVETICNVTELSVSLAALTHSEALTLHYDDSLGFTSV